MRYLTDGSACQLGGAAYGSNGLLGGIEGETINCATTRGEYFYVH